MYNGKAKVMIQLSNTLFFSLAAADLLKYMPGVRELDTLQKQNLNISGQIPHSPLSCTKKKSQKKYYIKTAHILILPLSTSQ